MPHPQGDPQYVAACTLLAAAPPSGEARRNFAASLLEGATAAADGSDVGVWGQVADLLELALEAELLDPAALAPAPAAPPSRLLALLRSGSLRPAPAPPAAASARAPAAGVGKLDPLRSWLKEARLEQVWRAMGALKGEPADLPRGVQPRHSAIPPG